MPELLHYVIDRRKPDYYSGAMDAEEKTCETTCMKFRLQQYRNEARLTQTQVADALGISQGLYAQLESGKRRMNETYLDALAVLYNVHPTQLIIDPNRDDPLYHALDAAYRQLSPAERKILVDSAKGILSGRQKETERR